MRKMSTALTALVTGLAGLVIGVASVPADASSRTCHSTYYEYAHTVPTHTVKANSKHSAYTIGAHSISGHWIYKNC